LDNPDRLQVTKTVKASRGIFGLDHPTPRRCGIAVMNRKACYRRCNSDPVADCNLTRNLGWFTRNGRGRLASNGWARPRQNERVRG
jgi:hypothetical protein